MTVRRSDDATVAKSLLYEAVMLLYKDFVVAVKFLIPLYGSEIC